MPGSSTSAGPAHGAGRSPSPLEAVRRIGDGQGSILLVSGGSREGRRAFLESLERVGSDAGWEVLRLHVHPLDAMVPYGALSPWLARWYRTANEVEPPVASGPSPPPHYTMPLVGLIAGIPSQPDLEAEPSPRESAPRVELSTNPRRSYSPAELRSAMTDLVQGRTRQTPAVIIVEDADRLDPASCDWFAHLGPRLAGLPMAVAFSLEGEPEVWTERFAQAPLVLCPLPAGAPASTARDRLRPILRSFPPRTLDALAIAVLAGPDADRSLLKEILRSSDQELNLALSPVMDEGLLRMIEGRYECSEPSLFPSLLGVLPPPQLASVHRAIATYLGGREGHAQGQLLFRLGHHWAEAGEVAHAAPALLAAAKEAERWGSPELAEQRLLRGIVLAQSDPTVRGREAEEQMYAELASLRLRAGRPSEGAEAYQRALALAKGRGTKVLHWGRYVAGLADAQAALGQHPDELLRSTLAQVEGRSFELEALLLRSLALYLVERARFGDAITTIDRACTLAEKGRETVLKVQCHSSAARARILAGVDLDRARVHLLQALEHRAALEGTVDELLVVSLLDGLSLLECSVGNEKESLRWGEEALALARREGYGTTFLWVLGNLAEEYLHNRDLGRSKVLTEEFRRHLERLSVADRDSLRQQLYVLEGRIAAETGDPGAARERLERIVAGSEQGGSRILLAQALVHLIVVSVRYGDMESARGYARQLERSGLRKSLMGECRRLMEQVEPRLRSA